MNLAKPKLNIRSHLLQGQALNIGFEQLAHRPSQKLLERAAKCCLVRCPTNGTGEGVIENRLHEWEKLLPLSLLVMHIRLEHIEG